MSDTLKALQADGSSDATALRCLQQDGPPFIFAASEHHPVGTRFELVGQLFVIARECTADEYRGRQAEIGAPDHSMLATHFFEAVTD